MFGKNDENDSKTVRFLPRFRILLCSASAPPNSSPRKILMSRRPRRKLRTILNCEQLEARQMMAGAWWIDSNNVLRINDATTGNDTLIVTSRQAADGPKVVFQLNGTSPVEYS